MPRRPRVARRSAGLGMAGLLAMALSAVPAVAAQRPFTLDLGVRTDFVAQTNNVQCVGASMQMMLNMVAPGADRTAKTQRRLQGLARAWSPPRPDGRVRRGANVIGWALGLTLAGAGPYRVVGLPTLDEALLEAARAMRTTGRPVGLLVWRGRHAWVMSGFRSTSDPSVKGAKVTAAIVEDPLYPHGSKVWGPSPAPGEALSVKEVGRQFVRRGNNSWGTRETAGMYVLVLPYELDAPMLDRPVGSPRSGRPADVHGPRLSKDHSPRSRRPGLQLQLGPVVEDSING